MGGHLIFWWLVAGLFLRRVGPEGRLVNKVERVFGESVLEVFQRHLFEGKDIVPLCNSGLINFNSLVGTSNEGLDFFRLK